MKAVILAAGQCSRMRPVSASPKCLLPVGDQTLLDLQLETLASEGIDQIAIVVGYRGEEIVRHVQSRHAARNVSFIENPAYALTNNSYSLLLAESWIATSKFICLNADVLYHPGILFPAVQTTAPISMVVDPEFREETMKVIIRDGQIVQMRKGIPQDQFSGTYLGITTFSAAITPWFFFTLSEMISNGRHREFFNIAVQELADNGAKISYTLTSGLPWAEIDDPNDYFFARDNVAPQLVEELWGSPTRYEIREVAW